eukprot:Lankesteria_metandrocarpae@DN5146_c0_g1_i2.p1
MTLEAVLLCVDNSDWSRNADYLPTRFEAQHDCVNLICGAKMQANPENAVGVLTMAHEKIDVRVAPTDDIGKVIVALQSVPLAGHCDFVRGIQTAQLALKHRMNKNQRQRIILFACSPIQATERQLEQIGKMLKKNSVSLDIVSFGGIEDNEQKLTKLYTAVNSGNTSHLVLSPPGVGLLSDVVLSSSIVLEEGAALPAAALHAADGLGVSPADFGGVNPASDPELYMALRLSLEEERARQERNNAAASATNEGEGQTAAVVPPTDDTAQVEAPIPNAIPTVDEIHRMDVDEELRQALLLSVQDYGGDSTQTAEAANDPNNSEQQQDESQETTSEDAKVSE